MMKAPQLVAASAPTRLYGRANGTARSLVQHGGTLRLGEKDDGGVERTVSLIAHSVGARVAGILQLAGDGNVVLTGVWRARRRGRKLIDVSVPLRPPAAHLLSSQPLPTMWFGSKPAPEASRRIAQVLGVASICRSIEIPLRWQFASIGLLVLLSDRELRPIRSDLLSMRLAGDLIGRMLLESPAVVHTREAIAAHSSVVALSVPSLQQAIDALREEIAVLDAEGRVLSANRQWLGAHGPREIGHLPFPGESYLSLWESIRSPAAADITKGVRSVIRRLEDRFEFLFRSPCQNCWFELTVTRIDFAGSSRLLVVHHDVTDAERSARALRVVSRRLLRAQESERRRIAGELHDGTAQNLTAISLALTRLESAIPARDASARSLLTETRELAGRCVAQIRTLSYLLHPPMLDEQGLVCAIRWYLSGFVKRSGIRVDLSVSSDFGRLPRRVERTLFLVVQECLTNVYRHAASDVARVDLRRSGHYVVVEISDEGDRLSSEQRDALQKAVGVGIRSIRERLQIIGGKFELQPQEKGLRAIATVPFISRSEGRANPDRG